MRRAGQGRAVVALDGAPPVVMNSTVHKGLVFTEVWNTQATPAPIDNGADPTAGRSIQVAPSPRGTIVRVVDLPPEGQDGPEVDPEEARKLLDRVGLGHGPAAGKPRHPFMHRTQTVDYGIVVSGEVHLVLDDEDVHLRAGDIVIQRGTIHAWSNRGDIVCRMVFVLIDGVFADGVPSG